MPQFVKKFDINGVKTKQVACIELHGKPNAATKGAVGVLGIDVDSPGHEIYKCVAVNGSLYTWEICTGGGGGGGSDGLTEGEVEEVREIAGEVAAEMLDYRTPTRIDLSALDTEGKIVETFRDGSTETTTMEFDADGNPVKITDMDGNETVLVW